MKSHEAVTLRELRDRFPEVRRYLDNELSQAFRCYCETNHGASWTDADLAEFVRWATTSPLERIRKNDAL